VASAACVSVRDAASWGRLDRGARLMEVLRQGQGEPMAVEEEVVSPFVGTRGHLASGPLEDVQRFEREFLAYLRRTNETVLKDIVETGKLSEDAEKSIVSAVDEFKKQFTASDGSSVVPGEEKVDAMAADEVGQETVKVNRPAPKK